MNLLSTKSIISFTIRLWKASSGSSRRKTEKAVNCQKWFIYLLDEPKIIFNLKKIPRFSLLSFKFLQLSLQLFDLRIVLVVWFPQSIINLHALPHQVIFNFIYISFPQEKSLPNPNIFWLGWNIKPKLL